MFDRIIVVDWSASARPSTGRDSIWLAVAAGEQFETSNPPTRSAAMAKIDTILDVDPTVTTLVGVDFSLGFPAGTAAALGLTGAPWSALWALLAERIVDADDNSNNRFAVAAELNLAMTARAAPFWGCPPSERRTTLSSTKPKHPTNLDEWRIVESRLRDVGRRPFSAWQLLGAGAVGSQSLVGIPRLRQMHDRFGDRADIWPFTTGLAVPTIERGAVVVAEVWPSMFSTVVPAGRVRDEVQVTTVARALVAADRSGALREWFAPDVDELDRAVIEDEEGWVLGVEGVADRFRNLIDRPDV